MGDKLEKSESGILLSGGGSLNVRRVMHEGDVRDLFRREIFGKQGIDITHPPEKEKGKVVPLSKAIEDICDRIRDSIVWGIYGSQGKLEKITEITEVSQLEARDAKDFKTLYVEGIQDVPENFGSTFETMRGTTTVQLRRFIENNYVLGVKHSFLDEEGKQKKKLIGMANLRRETGNRSHRAWFGGLYVLKHHRGRGIARDLTMKALDQALEQGIEVVQLIVTASNKYVIEWYERLGFVRTTIEYNAAKVNGISYDWQHMELDMRTYAATQMKEG